MTEEQNRPSHPMRAMIVLLFAVTALIVLLALASL